MPAVLNGLLRAAGLCLSHRGRYLARGAVPGHDALGIRAQVRLSDQEPAAPADGAAFDATQASLRTYLFGIVRHLAWKRSRPLERESDEVDDCAAGVDPLRELLESERAGMVERAVAALPLLQCEALVLFEYEELSLEEIAGITGADVGASKARLFRARESTRLDNIRRRLSHRANTTWWPSINRSTGRQRPSAACGRRAIGTRKWICRPTVRRR